MERTPIKTQHLVMAQRIISFVQEQGWDIEAIAIARYDDNENPLIGAGEGEDWKGPKLKWSLRLSVAPRDDDSVKVPVKEPI
jgi:hypothetical protein